ncbi:hypothetical protein LXA43DRAFT_1128567 [Ganoderma leucocontextum]|nr:hypothetical protein LXA43DRAFT_1128567 [Ganoderma leucocontextum]
MASRICTCLCAEARYAGAVILTTRAGNSVTEGRGRIAAPTRVRDERDGLSGGSTIWHGLPSFTQALHGLPSHWACCYQRSGRVRAFGECVPGISFYGTARGHHLSYRYASNDDRWNKPLARAENWDPSVRERVTRRRGEMRTSGTQRELIINAYRRLLASNGRDQATYIEATPGFRVRLPAAGRRSVQAAENVELAYRSHQVDVHQDTSLPADGYSNKPVLRPVNPLCPPGPSGAYFLQIGTDNIHEGFDGYHIPKFCNIQRGFRADRAHLCPHRYHARLTPSATQMQRQFHLSDGTGQRKLRIKRTIHATGVAGEWENADWPKDPWWPKDRFITVFVWFNARAINDAMQCKALRTLLVQLHGCHLRTHSTNLSFTRTKRTQMRSSRESYDVSNILSIRTAKETKKVGTG